MKKDCCCMWLELSKEVIAKETAILDALIEKGTPRYALAVAYAQMANMGNYCPSCGGALSSEAIEKRETIVLVEQPPVAPPKPPVVATRTVQNTCTKCKGTGYTGGEVGVGAKCMPCLGQGFYNNNNKPAPPLSPEKQDALLGVSAKIEREKKPLREDAKKENWGKE